MPEKPADESPSGNANDIHGDSLDVAELVEQCIAHDRKVVHDQIFLESAMKEFARGLREEGITVIENPVEMIMQIFHNKVTNIKRETVERLLMANGIFPADSAIDRPDVIRTDISGAMFWGDEDDD